MRLLINTASCARGGSVQVAKSFLEETKSFDRHEYGVILGPSLSDIDTTSFPENFKFYYQSVRPSQKIIRSLVGDTFSQIEDDFRPDCVFTTSGPSYWKSRAPHLIGYNLPHYIYPESPFFDRIGLREKIIWGCKKRVIGFYYRRDADAVVVQTKDVAQRLENWVRSKRSFVVSNTCGAQYFTGNYPPISLPYRKPGEKRLLCFSAYYKHKNFEMIRDLIILLDRSGDQRIRFVLTIAESDFDLIFGDLGTERIINLGPVNPAQGPSLYQQVDCLFLPTLLECFSASYVESMAMKCPIITSDLGFARSICGDAALYFDPDDPKDALSAIKAVLDDASAMNGLKEHGKRLLPSFNSAQERAKSYLEICQELAGR